jgi:transcription elongation factor Elf1
MRLNCVSCGHELVLDHWVFDDYEGLAKCSSCSRMMEVKTAKGVVHSINPSPIPRSKRNVFLVGNRD